MLAFYFDHHVPGAITNGLERRGIDVLTAWDDGRARLPDESLLERATELNRILVTLDKGFHRLAKRWRMSGREFGGNRLWNSRANRSC
jgi:predicted nuclease of predicted toxin-antitoxin system